MNNVYDFCWGGNSADTINNVDNGGESEWTNGNDDDYSGIDDDDDGGWCSCFSEMIDVSEIHGKCKSQQSCTEEIVWYGSGLVQTLCLVLPWWVTILYISGSV